jgi:hypothetical protein
VKQILQNLKNGATELIDKPCPLPSRHQLFIKTSASLVSAGTERMLIDFGKGNYLQKARQQPDKVKMVIDKIKTDGLMPTIDSVLSSSLGLRDQEKKAGEPSGSQRPHLASGSQRPKAQRPKACRNN